MVADRRPAGLPRGRYPDGDPRRIDPVEQTGENQLRQKQHRRYWRTDDFGHTKDKLSGSIDANRDFDGSATSQQQNSLRGEITVSVHAVQPNGILEIRGEKWLTLNQGDEYIRLSGLVRADDIQNDNSVSSQRIADARISYAGRGALSDANAAGWLTRLFNHPLFPI